MDMNPTASRASYTARDTSGNVPLSVGETLVYPSCQRGEPSGFAHDFASGQGQDEDGRDAPLLYCRLCGQIRKFRYEP